jgi:hypothetical protein
MSDLAHPADVATGRFRPASGLSLLGEHQGSAFAESQFQVRRGDGRVIQLSGLLYLVSVAIAEAAVDGNGGASAELVAARVSRAWGHEVTAADIGHLVTANLVPLGIVVAGATGWGSAHAAGQTIDEAPTTPLPAIPPAPGPNPPPAPEPTPQAQARGPIPQALAPGPIPQAPAVEPGPPAPAPSPQAPAPAPRPPAPEPSPQAPAPELSPRPPAPEPRPPATQTTPPRHRPRRAVALGALAVVVAAAAVTLVVTTVKKPGPPPASAADNQARAAAWVAQQVSPGTVVSCDPATCAQVRRNGFPSARLVTLVPATRDPLGSAVVISTAAVRHQFGSRLATVYAPVVIAGFGTGANRVEVRATAPDGAAALAAEVKAQRASLRSAGQLLLRNRTVQATPAARAALLAGRVDPRLLANLSVLSSQRPITVVAFDGAPPGASSAVPLPGVQLSAASAAGRSAILAFLRIQRGTYRPAVAAVARDAGGQPVVTARFDAPDPLSAP